MADIRCHECGHVNDLGEGDLPVCAACGHALDVTIDLEQGRIEERRTVLIVDDEPDVRSVARALLSAHGFEVVGEASNGPDAALLASEHLPAVVVLDQRMPAMSGEHTARLLRRVSPGSLIVAFSAVLERRPPWADASLRKDEADRLPEVVASVSRAGVE